MKINIIFIGIILIFFISCKSSSSSSPNGTAIATLIDANVNGISYNCDNGRISGVTGDSGGTGTFKYDSKCAYISFTLGSVTLANIKPNDIPLDKKLFITDLVGVDRNNTRDIRVTNIIRILQTLNGENKNDPRKESMTIDTTLKNNIQNTFIDLSNANINNNDLKRILNDANATISLYDIDYSLVFFEIALRDHNITIDTVKPFKPELITKQKHPFFNTSKNEFNDFEYIATRAQNVSISFFAEKNTDFYVDNQKHSIVSSDWYLRYDFNISNTDFSKKFIEKSINIMDKSNKLSDTYKLKLFNISNSSLLDKSSYDINITQNNYCEINISDILYEAFVDLNLTNENPHLFDINDTSFQMLDFNYSNKLYKLQYDGNITKDHNLTIKVTQNRVYNGDIKNFNVVIKVVK
jgi:hypothetical protein